MRQCSIAQSSLRGAQATKQSKNQLATPWIASLALAMKGVGGVSKGEAAGTGRELCADGGGEVGDRLHDRIAHAGIVERVPGPSDDTDLGFGPGCAQRM